MTTALLIDAKIDVPFKALGSSGWSCIIMSACKEVQYQCPPSSVCSTANQRLKKIDMGWSEDFLDNIHKGKKLFDEINCDMYI